MLHNVRTGTAARRRAIRRRIGELLHPPEPFPAGRDGYPCSARVLFRVPFAAATMTCGHPLGLASVLGRELAGEPAVFLLGLTWHIETSDRATTLARRIARYRRRLPRHRNHRALQLAGGARSPHRIRYARRGDEPQHLRRHQGVRAAAGREQELRGRLRRPDDALEAPDPRLRAQIGRPCFRSGGVAALGGDAGLFPADAAGNAKP